MCRSDGCGVAALARDLGVIAAVAGVVDAARRVVGPAVMSVVLKDMARAIDQGKFLDQYWNACRTAEGVGPEAVAEWEASSLFPRS